MTSTLLKADYILANPPFNLSDWGADKLQDDVRWKYGIPPSGNANFAWIQHMIHHLSPHGRIGMVLAIDPARKDEALKLLADNNEPAYVLGQIAADTTGTQIVLK